MATHTIVVRRQGKRWGIYLDRELHEGGFFDKEAAERAAKNLRTSLNVAIESRSLNMLQSLQ